MDKKETFETGKSISFLTYLLEFLLADIEELINTLNLSTKLTEKDAEIIFNELDIEQKGYLYFNVFINRIINKTRDNQKSNSYSEFYFKTMNFLLIPSQRIIKSIQKAITKLNSKKELDTIKELEWVIQTLNKKDLSDFSLKKEVIDITDLKENEILNFLSEYSSENVTSIKIDDINTCNIIEHNKEKSPKHILEKVCINTNQHQELLKKLDKEDFNIFEFEKEVTSDMVLPLIGMQILSLDQFLTCLDSTKLDAFLLNVKMGYLKNPYHNVSKF